MYKYNIDYIHPSSKKTFEDEIRRSRFSNKKLEVREYYDAIIDFSAEKDALVINSDQRYNSMKISEEKETCVFLGYFVSCWGHILTDGFKRLWFFDLDYCKKLIEEGIDFVYVTRPGKDMLDANKEILRLVGIDCSSFKKVTKITKYKKVIVPDDCFWGGIIRTTFTKEYVSQIDSFRNKLFLQSNSNVDKVYFTRTLLGDSREKGEKAIEKEFKKMGYKIYAPEKLTVQEQLYLVSHCKAFASTEGSIAHISVFCQPGTNVTIIRKADYTNGYQLAINEVADLNVTYVDAHESQNVSTEFPWCGPFYLCVNTLFQDFVGHIILHIPYYLRPSWWWYMNRNRKIVHKVMNCFQK